MDINQFSISISKEQLSTLPTVEFPGRITVLETVGDARAALRYLRKCGTVGFDTETKPNFRKGQTNTVSLIQVSTLDHSFLFRLNKLGFFQEMRDFMEADDVVKVGLSLRTSSICRTSSRHSASPIPVFRRSTVSSSTAASPRTSA